MTTDPIIRVDHVSKAFRTRSGDVQALDDVTLSVRRGTTLAVVGESGSGKTTLGRCLLGLSSWDSGTISIGEHDVAKLSKASRGDFRRKVQMVFQDPFASLNPRMRVGQVLEEPLLLRGRERGARREEVLRCLEHVQLDPSYVSRYPGELSGGQAQRIGIARAIIGQPEVVVLDEPTAALDAEVRRGIYQLLQRLQAELGLTYVLISHDLASVAATSDAIAVMHRGRIVEYGTTEDVFERPRHPYSVALISASPRLGVEFVGRERVAVLRGEDVLARADQCHLSSRCPVALEVCRSGRPAFEAVDGAHACACWRVAEMPGVLDAAISERALDAGQPA
ncbi:oligopeptide/dipeptide ABC transporter ATP-binding protein [Nonomuraea cavernae]|uniref:oligopeptide/dipeptide ABC transporter ATP-binding protein n=1 Tax=Nonomuraea cavernae TaxID=2045107 RepID=UPI0033E3C9BD